MKAFLVALTSLLVVVGFVYACTIPDRWGCRARAKMMAMPYDYSFMTGCMVMARNQWVPIENYKVIE